MGIPQSWTILLINNLRMYINDKMGIMWYIILLWCLLSVFTFILHWYFHFLLSFNSDTFSFYVHFTLMLSVSAVILEWYFQFLLSFYFDAFCFCCHFRVILFVSTFILQWYFGVYIDRFITLHHVQYTCKITYVTWSWYLQWCSRCQN
jgi:hypothetical protein